MKTAQAKQNHVVLGVHVTDRLKNAAAVQKALSSNGNIIRTRIGLHEVSEGFSVPGGLIVLELAGDRASQQRLVRDLRKVKGIEVKAMVFEH